MARELGLTKSNVHRLLTTLQTQSYVRKLSNNSTYELTSTLWEIGPSCARGSMSSRLRARRWSSSNERQGTRYISRSWMAARLFTSISSTVGGRAPLWCVATGKALLAHAPARLSRMWLSILSDSPRAPSSARTACSKSCEPSEETATPSIKANGARASSVSQRPCATPPGAARRAHAGSFAGFPSLRRRLWAGRSIGAAAAAGIRALPRSRLRYPPRPRLAV
jgi:IclR helix-turn-helix domain